MPLKRMGLHAASSFSTVGAVITNVGSVGCVPSYTGVGDANLTLDQGVDNAEMCLLATIRGATIGSVRFVNTSDTVKQILLRNETAGGLAAAEREVDVLVINLNKMDRRLVKAAGHYNGSLGAGAVAFGQRGGVVARTGAGVYTITLDQPMDATECAVIVTVGVGAAAATDVHARVVHTSDTVKTVTLETLVAGADTDADFCWAVFDLREAASYECYGIGGIAAAGGTVRGRGCLPARNGAGDYQYTMDRSSAAGEYIGLATTLGATGLAIRVNPAAVGRKDVACQTQAGPGTMTDGDNNAVFIRLA